MMSIFSVLMAVKEIGHYDDGSFSLNALNDAFEKDREYYF
jgi:hypothetical protein